MLIINTLQFNYPKYWLAIDWSIQTIRAIYIHFVNINYVSGRNTEVYIL